MARTYFQKFTKDDGTPIEVEYSFASGSETTYSPAYGACGGDACEVEILKSWPHNEEYDALVGRQMELESSGPYGAKISVIALQMQPEVRNELEELDRLIETADKTAELSDAERERMEAWICEHHEYEPYEPEIDF
jgi:hypothetical protein